MPDNMAYMAKSYMQRTPRGLSSHPHFLQNATLGLSVKGVFYCHATKCMKLALIGRKRTRGREGQRENDVVTYITRFCFNQQW